MEYNFNIHLVDLEKSKMKILLDSILLQQYELN